MEEPQACREMTPGEKEAYKKEQKDSEFRFRQEQNRKRREKIQATNDAILLIIDGLPYDQREFDVLLNDISSGNLDWLETWVQEHFTISVPADVEPEDCEITWA